MWCIMNRKNVYAYHISYSPIWLAARLAWLKSCRVNAETELAKGYDNTFWERSIKDCNMLIAGRQNKLEKLFG